MEYGVWEVIRGVIFYQEQTLIFIICRSLIILICISYIRTSSPPWKQRITTKPIPFPGKNKSDEGRIDRNRALIPEASTYSVVELERYYEQAASLPAELKSNLLYDIGCKYCIMYTTTNEMEYLERAISICDEALQNASSQLRPPQLSKLATCLLERFKRTGSHDDIEHALLESQDAVHIAETGNPNRQRYILVHAIALLERFGVLRKLGDLQNSISFANTAMELTPDGHPDEPICHSTLGSAFWRRFDLLGRVEDLEMAIAHNLKVVDLTPDGHLDKPGYLNKLGNIFERRFNRLGCVEDLEVAIAHKQKAIELTPDSHSDKSLYCSGLGNTFKRRFDRLGRVEDLEVAIAHMQKAIDLIPDNHPSKVLYLSHLGYAFEARFGLFGCVGDMKKAITLKQEAVDLTPDSHPRKPIYLNSLGTAFEASFDRLGHIEDLEVATAHQQKAVDLMPDSHPDMPKCLASLGGTFERRFNQLGCVEDLEVAIAHKQKAVDLTPDGHPGKPFYLNSLGNAFMRRFDWLACVEDLEAAIMHIQKAVDLMPDGHPSKILFVNNLGSAFGTRFDLLGHVGDLRKAIALKQNAVDLTPDSHPRKPVYLSSLGSTLERRFNRLGCVEDLEVIIAHMQKAVDLTPDGHPSKPYRFDSLGSAFTRRFQQFGHIKDLEIAITHRQMAVNQMPDDDPHKPTYLNYLGNAFGVRFERLGRVEDLETALIQFSTAASLATASPRVRLIAAREWARASELLETFKVSISSPLEPYQIAIDLLPRVAWLGIPMSNQHALLETVGETVREAVSAAIRVGEYETAVEWAEAGRSIAWQNLLKVRTPVNELRSAHYNLANRLETISRQLDTSVRGGHGRMNDETDGMEEVSRSHVQLALDWDNTVADIRSNPGFESFLKPKRFNQLKRIAHNGPVVILNITKVVIPNVIEDRCDALILIPEERGNVHVSGVSLPGFSYVRSETLLKELKRLLQSRNLLERGPMKRRPPRNEGKSNLVDILRCLWTEVIKPIIEALAYRPCSTDLPRIWWCATGPLAFLPIHAAGLYDTDEFGSKLSDYVVSSYTPTLSALLDDSTPSQEDLRLLTIAQAKAPGAASIPGTEVEVKKIQTLVKNISITTMTKEDATVENVRRVMEESNWVHLACHGQQNIKEPMKSGLLLHDGTLELQRLIKKPFSRADFAFLSACQTATGEDRMAEESVHLAAGMLFAGYKGVIATMWSIKDHIGPRVAEDVYREMLKDGKPNRKAAAHALHKAVKRLREDPKVDMLHWVPFIHIGL